MRKYFIYVILVSFGIASSAFASEKELKTEINKLKLENEATEKKLQSLQQDMQNEIKKLNEKSNEHSKDKENSSSAIIGGYGEIVYNAYSKNSSRNQMDLKRFVLSVNKNFNDKLSFNGEMEWEHAITSAGDQGEAAIEQAYINYQISPNLNLKTGLFLIPIGFLNESHEPPVFYGVERNEVETRIIPTSWREGGLGLSGTTDMGIEWNLGVVTGFDLPKFEKPEKPLGGIHQELQLAKARDLSYYAGINYKIPGFLIGSTLFTGKAMQGNADYLNDSTKPNFDGIDSAMAVADLHARWQHNGWDLQGLIAKGTFDNSLEIDQVIQAYNILNTTNLPYIPSEFNGWLIQAAYSVPVCTDSILAPFVRVEEYDTQAKMPVGFAASAANANHVTTTGLSFKPVAQVVFKADYQNYNESSQNNRFNLGMGYMF